VKKALEKVAAEQGAATDANAAATPLEEAKKSAEAVATQAPQDAAAVVQAAATPPDAPSPKAA
jgi:hypothetical protein